MSIIQEIKDTELFISKAKSVYGDLYEYPLTVFRGDYIKTQIRCRRHKDVTIVPIEFLTSGHGCPVCWHNKPYGEQKVFQVLKENGIEFFCEYKFPDLKFKDFLRFDFYIPSQNCCIEFQGIQHFIPVKKFGGKEEFLLRQKRDEMKRSYCKEKNIELIEIRYDEVEKAEELLKDVIEMGYEILNENGRISEYYD